MLQLDTNESDGLNRFIKGIKYFNDNPHTNRYNPGIFDELYTPIHYSIDERHFHLHVEAVSTTHCNVGVAEFLNTGFTKEDVLTIATFEKKKATKESLRRLARGAIAAHLDRFPVFRWYTKGKELGRQLFQLSKHGDLVAWDVTNDKPKTQDELNQMNWVKLKEEWTVPLKGKPRKRPYKVQRAPCPSAISPFKRGSTDLPKTRELYGLLGVKLSGADLQKKNLQGINLSNKDLVKTNLNRANLNDSTFTWASLHKASLHKASIKEANFELADLEGADLSGSNLLQSNFHMARMAGAQLPRSNISVVKFHRARLDGADLQECRAMSVNFQAASLKEANLNKAKMEGMDGRNADFQSADLMRADLTSADFSYANLSGALLQDANLIHANLSGARLTGAKYSLRTVWPRGFDPEKAGAIRDKELDKNRWQELETDVTKYFNRKLKRCPRQDIEGLMIHVRDGQGQLDLDVSDLDDFIFKYSDQGSMREYSISSNIARYCGFLAIVTNGAGTFFSSGARSTSVLENWSPMYLNECSTARKKYKHMF